MLNIAASGSNKPPLNFTTRTNSIETVNAYLQTAIALLALIVAFVQLLWTARHH
jgi:hypothetical protein